MDDLEEQMKNSFTALTNKAFFHGSLTTRFPQYVKLSDCALMLL